MSPEDRATIEEKAAELWDDYWTTDDVNQAGRKWLAWKKEQGRL